MELLPYHEMVNSHKWQMNAGPCDVAQIVLHNSTVEDEPQPRLIIDVSIYHSIHLTLVSTTFVLTPTFQENL